MEHKWVILNYLNLAVAGIFGFLLLIVAIQRVRNRGNPIPKVENVTDEKKAEKKAEKEAKHLKDKAKKDN